MMTACMSCNDVTLNKRIRIVSKLKTDNNIF